MVNNRFSENGISTGFKWRLSSEISAGGRITGSHVIMDEIPQYLYFVGGNLDADFENIIWDRSGDSNFGLLERQISGKTAHLRIAPAEDMLAYESALVLGGEVVGIGQVFGVFADYLYSPDKFGIGNKNYTSLSSAGLSLNIEFLSVYIPLYMSWGDNIEFGSDAWLDHIRAEITFSLSSLLISM